MSVKFRPIQDVIPTKAGTHEHVDSGVRLHYEFSGVLEKALKLVKASISFKGKTGYAGSASDVYTAKRRLPEAVAKAIDDAVARSGLTGTRADEMRKSLTDVVLQRLEFTDNIV